MYKSPIYYISIFLNAVIFLFFSAWFLQNDSNAILPAFFSILSVALICVFISRSVLPLENAFFISDKNLKRNVIPKAPETKSVLIYGGAFAAWILLINLWMIIGFKNGSIPSASFSERFNFYLDSPKYLEIAQNWYDSNSEAVYPFYVALIGLFEQIGSPYPIAVFVNGALAVGCGILLYCLALFDYDEKTALKAAILFFLFPSGFFLIAPINLCALLFISLIYVLAVRARKWGTSFAVGFLAGLTDKISILLLLVAVSELISSIREDLTDKRVEGQIRLDVTPYDIINKAPDTSAYISYGFSLLGIPAAILFFQSWLRKNVLLSFLSFINESRTFFYSNIFDAVLRVQTATDVSRPAALASYLPAIVLTSVVLAVLACGAKSARGTYAPYCAAFFLTIFSAENYYAVSKYILLLFPIYFMMAKILEGVSFGVACAAFFIIYVYYFSNFINGAPVY